MLRQICHIRVYSNRRVRRRRVIEKHPNNIILYYKEGSSWKTERAAEAYYREGDLKRYYLYIVDRRIKMSLRLSLAVVRRIKRKQRLTKSLGGKLTKRSHKPHPSLLV